MMWSNAMAVLQQLGLAEKVLAAGTPIERSLFRTTDGRPLIDIPVGELSREAGAPTVVISRRALLGILAGPVPPGAISFGRRCERFEVRDGAVHLHFAEGPVAVGRGLVGADGLHSVVRSQLLGPSPARKAHQTAWVGISPRVYDAFPAGIMIGFVGNTLRFWGTRIGSDRTYWYAIVKDTNGGATPRVESRQSLMDEFSTWQAPVAELIRDTQESETVRTEIVDRPPSEVWGHGQTTLIGDAAHPMTPDLGQGACQAIEGSAVLAAWLSWQADPAAAFRHYERARMVRTTGISRLSRTIAELSMTESSIGASLRDVILTVGARFDTFPMLRLILGAQPPPVFRRPEAPV